MITFVVAASDANPQVQRAANYRCSGAADDVQIQAAINALPAGGGTVVLSEGTFNLTATLTLGAGDNLIGNGWATVVDVSGIATPTDETIEMGEGSFVGNFKILGDISVLETEGRELQAADNSQIEHIWMSHNNYGIDCTGAANVHIRDVRFDHIQGVNTWAACIHGSGSDSHELFISGVYMDTCDRGIEIENGAYNIYARDGYLDTVKPAGGGGFSLDAHTHNTMGIVKNVVYDNFYLHACEGLSASGADLTDDWVENIVFRNITLDTPDLGASMSCAFTQYAKHITFENLRILSPANTRVLAAENAQDVIFRHVTVSNANGTNALAASNSIGITVEAGSFKATNGTSYGLSITGGSAIKVLNNLFDDYLDYGAFQITGNPTDVLIQANYFSQAAGTGNYAIKLDNGTRVRVLDNIIESADAEAISAANVAGLIIRGNYCEDSILIAASCSDVRCYDNETPTTSAISDLGSTTPQYWGNVGGSIERLIAWVKDDAQNPNLGTLPANSFVLGTRMHVTEAFDSDGADEISIGYDANPDAFGEETDVSGTGLKTVTDGAEVGFNGTERAIEAYYVNGGSEPTQGKAFVALEFYQVNAAGT